MKGEVLRFPMTLFVAEESEMYSSTMPISSRARQLLTSAVVLILITLFLAPDALACHRGDPPKPHGKNATCDDGNPTPDRPPTYVETRAAIEGKVISDVPADGEGRTCLPGEVFTEEAGQYRCSTFGPGVMVNSAGLNGVWSRKDHPICKSLTSSIVLTPTENGYEYGWTDSCYADDCAVELHLIFEGDQILELTGGASDIMDMVMRATAVFDPNAVADSNPFLTFRDLQITSLTAEYLKTGSTRSAAVCDYYVTPPKERDRYPANLVSAPAATP